MTVKMYLPKDCGGFCFAGESLKVKGKEGSFYVIVPNDAVDAAMSHGLTQDQVPTDELVEGANVSGNETPS